MKEVLKYIVYAGVFATPFLALVVVDSWFFPFITGKNFFFRILVEVMVAAWAVLALWDAAYRPRFSWILGAFGAFIVVMFVANILGADPSKSFWSNFERMEGWVTLVHLFGYFVVVSSVLNTRKLWDYFFNTMLIAASLMFIFSLLQIAGFFEINQGGTRVDARLGNAAYNAIYMLFHAFIAGLMFVRTESRNLRILYGALAAGFVYVLFTTATRGAILGLTGGALLSAAYITLFGKEYKTLRKVGAGALIALVVAIGGFFLIKDTDFVRENPILTRIASISLEEGSTRFTIWGMAFEGFKERPVLGWGQGNFSHVFNQEYEPSLYAQEPWFDRVHNIFFDWLIAGGIFGFVGYFSLLFFALYYAVLRPLWNKTQEHFTTVEQGLILGLLAGYFFHNLFVFDNVISYLLYASILAFIHVRVAREIPAFTRIRISEKTVSSVALPTAAVLLALVFYFVNVPGMLAASGIIDSFGEKTAEGRIAAFERTLGYDSFGQKEVREHYVRTTQGILSDQNVPQDVRTTLAVRLEEELRAQIEETPRDTRALIFLATFYRANNESQKAVEVLKTARATSPQKQTVLFELGFAYLGMNDREAALEVYRDAYELAPEFTQARLYYAMAAIYAGRDDLMAELITPEYRDAYVSFDPILGAAYNTGDYNRVIDILRARVEAEPDNIQNHVSLAVAQTESGDRQAAIATLQAAIEEFPGFEAQGQQFIENIRDGKPLGG